MTPSRAPDHVNVTDTPLREVLAARGYKEVPCPDTRDYNFVLVGPAGHHVDVHRMRLTTREATCMAWRTCPSTLTGTGSIDGYLVKCISAEWMVKFHSGYALDENDYRDVLALCRRFEHSAAQMNTRDSLQENRSCSFGRDVTRLAHAACRSASNRLSHSPIWFQLAKVRLTIHRQVHQPLHSTLTSRGR